MSGLTPDIPPISASRRLTVCGARQAVLLDKQAVSANGGSDGNLIASRSKGHTKTGVLYV